jgi:hypothetical protein
LNSQDFVIWSLESIAHCLLAWGLTQSMNQSQ